MEVHRKKVAILLMGTKSCFEDQQRAIGVFGHIVKALLDRTAPMIAKMTVLISLFKKFMFRHDSSSVVRISLYRYF